MKKFVLGLMVLAMAAACASAGVLIDWQVAFGAYSHEATDLTADDESDSILANYQVTWQLIYAGANNLADPIDVGNSAGGWVSGDDVVWGSRVIPGIGVPVGDGTSWTTWLYLDSGNATYEDLNWNTAGYVYQRLYENPVQAGAWYYQGGLEALDTAYEVGNPSQKSYLEGDPMTTSGVQPNQQVPIPEPATMSLLGLGALAMVMRRRLRK